MALVTQVHFFSGTVEQVYRRSFERFVRRVGAGGAPSAGGAERGGLRTQPRRLRSGGSLLDSRQDHRAVAPGVCSWPSLLLHMFDVQGASSALAKILTLWHQVKAARVDCLPTSLASW